MKQRVPGNCTVKHRVSHGTLPSGCAWTSFSFTGNNRWTKTAQHFCAAAHVPSEVVLPPSTIVFGRLRVSLWRIRIFDTNSKLCSCNYVASIQWGNPNPSPLTLKHLSTSAYRFMFGIPWAPFSLVVTHLHRLLDHANGLILNSITGPRGKACLRCVIKPIFPRNDYHTREVVRHHQRITSIRLDWCGRKLIWLVEIAVMVWSCENGFWDVSTSWGIEDNLSWNHTIKLSEVTTTSIQISGIKHC